LVTLNLVSDFILQAPASLSVVGQYHRNGHRLVTQKALGVDLYLVDKCLIFGKTRFIFHIP